MIHINPATEESSQIKETAVKDIPKIVENAKKAQKEWKNKSLKDRIRIIQPLAEVFEKDKERIAKIIATDMGKPLWRSINEVKGAVEDINYFCKKTPEFLKPKKIGDGCVFYEPLGVVAVISPWNYPISTAVSSIIPALLCGDSVILKPSEHSPLTGIEMEKIFNRINLPANIFSVVIGAKEHGKELVKQDIDLVSFTGSTAARKHVMKTSSEKLHRILLELGGLDAAIVLKDADVRKSAEEIVHRNAANSGQVCCAIKRVYVEKEIYKEFIEHAAEISRKITIGDPLEDVYMGPLVAEFQLKKVEEILEDAVKKGARVLTGGKRLKRKGYFFPLTIVVDVNHDMRLMNEEAFGPILPIYPVKNWQEGVELANNTRYGLTGSVWTKDAELGRRIAGMLEVGSAGINSHGGGGTGTPWGGAKESGIGRQNSIEGVRVFTNIKFFKERL